MLNKREALKGVTQTRAAQISTQKGDDGTLTFVMVSDKNDGERFDWGSGQFYVERLSIDGANTQSLNTFFKNHDRGVDDAIGKVTNTRKQDGQLLADVSFDDDGLSIKRKYENGTLTDVSIGYRINKYEVEEREGELDLVTITDYDIIELSAVGIGFDSGAKHTGRESNLNTGEEEMLKELMARLAELEKVSKRTDVENAELDKVRKDIEVAKEVELNQLRAKNAELTRKAEIDAVSAKYEPSVELRAKFEKDGTVDEFTRAILDEKSKAQPQFHAEVKDESTRESMIVAMTDAMALNAGVKVKDAHKDADSLRGASLTDFARKFLGVNSFDRNEIANRAMVTADFPLILANVANKVLAQGYDEEMATYGLWVKEVDVNDFKTNSDVTLGTSGRLSKLNEAGEITEKQLTESGESWKIESFANEFAITRQMIINDDLGAFNGLLAEFGKMAKRTANGIVYDLLQAKGAYASYKMKDGIAIFNTATHKNLASSGAALSAATLEAAMTAMKRQTTAVGDALNILPRFLIVAPEQEITALSIINSLASTTDSKNSNVINPFYKAMTVIVDSELDAGAWYLAGGTRTIKAGYLSGTGRRPIVQLDNTSLTRTVFQGVFDFGVVAEDYRSMYKNPGA
ncbi:MAG: Mu-like prophage major head subunit gpT family protein [Balneolaceae bacterium]